MANTGTGMPNTASPYLPSTPTAPPTIPAMLQALFVPKLSRNFFRFQNTPKRGVALQVTTFGHQYTWENSFVWEMHRSERLTRPLLIVPLSTLHIDHSEMSMVVLY